MHFCANLIIALRSILNEQCRSVLAGQRKVRGGGTLHHMAPELVSNYINKSAGALMMSFDGFACDVWALGVMLIQLLTGKLPFWPANGFDYQNMLALLKGWVRSLPDSQWYATDYIL